MPTLSAVAAANIRAERARKKWRQVDLAEALGVSAATVSEMESGKRKVGLDDLIPLCRAFGVDLSVFVRGLSREDLRTLGL
jgi:transcriptional regulator with XRE-family HTH domain